MQAQPVSIPPQNITAHVPGIDPAQVADTSVQAFDFSVRFIAEVPIGWVRDLLSIGNIWTQTPAALVYEQPAIQVLRPTMLGVAFGLLALVLLVAGLRRTLGQSLHPGRILYAVVLAVGAPVWWQIGVDLNNAICSSINAPGLPELMAPFLQTVEPSEAFSQAVLTAVYAISALTLVLGLLFRLGMVIVLSVIAPAALILYALPETEGLAQHYSKLSVGLLFCQVPIAVGLKLANDFAAIGGYGPAGTIMACVVLWLLIKLPGIVLRGQPSPLPKLDISPLRVFTK